MRVVPDLNVLVSSMLADGKSAELVRRWRQGKGLKLVVCLSLIGDLDEVLHRPKFRGRIGEEEIEILLQTLVEEGELRPNPTEIPPVLRDPDDDFLIALATESEVDGIVSGDSDVVDAEVKIATWTPTQLLEMLDRRLASDADRITTES